MEGRVGTQSPDTRASVRQVLKALTAKLTSMIANHRRVTMASVSTV